MLLLLFLSHAQAATLRVGNYEGEEVFTPFKALLPMVDPNDFVLGGWDISGLNMAEAMERAKVCRQHQRMREGDSCR